MAFALGFVAFPWELPARDLSAGHSEVGFAVPASRFSSFSSSGGSDVDVKCDGTMSGVARGGGGHCVRKEQ